MLLEGNVGADASLLANAGDIALANARANGAATPNLTGIIAAAPSNLTAPSSVVLAAVLFTGKGSEETQVNCDFYFTDSAADTLTFVVQEVGHATAIAGGAVTSGWHVENGGTAVSITGDAASTLVTVSKTVTTGALSASFNLSFVAATPAGQQVGFQFVISAAHNLSAMVFNGTLYEFA